MNLPNWTGDCTRHGVRVAIEVKYLMRALGSPHEYLSTPKDPYSRGFRGAKVLVRAPSALMRCLTSIATLTPCLVQPPVQLGKE